VPQPFRRRVHPHGPGLALIVGFELLCALIASGVLVVLLGLIGDTSERPGKPPVEHLSPPAPVAESERDGVLRLSIETPTGAPVSGATVRAFWQEQNRYFDAGRGVSGRDGKLRLDRVPRGSVWVLADADGRARASTQVLVEGSEREAKLILPEASALEVSVTDEAHAALPDATVLVTTADPLPFGALTNAQGKAHFDRLGRPPFTVKASAPGYESVTRSGVSGSVELSLRRLSAILVHVRLADGTAAAGARVEIGGATLWPARSTNADARGDCKISGLLHGSYDLRASRDQQVSRVLMGFQLERGAEQEVTLTLEPGRFVTALVTDGSGPNPHLVSGADVVLAEEGLSTFPLRGRSGTDGKVTLGPISNGPATLSGRAPDYVGSSVVSVPESTSEPVRLALLRGGALLGEVVDARGFPIAGASVELIGEDSMGLPISETPQLLRFRRSHFNWALAGPPPLIAAGELGQISACYRAHELGAVSGEAA